MGGANPELAGQRSNRCSRRQPPSFVLGSGDRLLGAAMESEWDALRALGAVTALWLLLRVTWEVGHLVYVYLLPQARRGAPWLRAHGAWAGEERGLCAKWVWVGAAGMRTGDR